MVEEIIKESKATSETSLTSKIIGFVLTLVFFPVLFGLPMFSGYLFNPSSFEKCGAIAYDAVILGLFVLIAKKTKNLGIGYGIITSGVFIAGFFLLIFYG